MQEARACFNPCEWRGAVYLCGLESIEAFSPETETFLPFTIQIPPLQDNGCCVYVDSDQLVVHSSGHIHKFAVQPGRKLALVAEMQSSAEFMHQNSMPVVDKAREVFHLVWEGECFTYNMDTGVRLV